MKTETPLTRLAYGAIRVGGEIGRRIDVTRDGNMLALDPDACFPDAYRRHVAADHVCGAPFGGMFLDALVQHAAYSRDARTLELKQRFVKELLGTLRPNGHIGVGGHWDRHEGAYIPESAGRPGTLCRG